MRIFTIPMLLLTTCVALGGQSDAEKAAEILRQAAPLPSVYIFNQDDPPEISWENGRNAALSEVVDLERNIVVAQVRERGSKADATRFPQFPEVVSQLTRDD